MSDEQAKAVGEKINFGRFLHGLNEQYQQIPKEDRDNSTIQAELINVAEDAADFSSQDIRYKIEF